MPNNNRCLYCNDIIPEGKQICPSCEQNLVYPKPYQYIKKNKFLNYISNNLIIFYILSFTWGLITSFIGLLLMLPFFISKNYKKINGRYYGVFSKKFGKGWGFEMGCFFFTSYDCSETEDICAHEMGHGIQNILWGPLMLFVISIPSCIRYWYREIKYYKKKITPPTEYDDIWFEKQATVFGMKYIRRNYKFLNERNLI